MAPLTPASTAVGGTLRGPGFRRVVAAQYSSIACTEPTMYGRLVAAATQGSGTPADTVTTLANRLRVGVGLNFATLCRVLWLGLGLPVTCRVGATVVTHPKKGSGSSAGSSTALTDALRLGHLELM